MAKTTTTKSTPKRKAPMMEPPEEFVEANVLPPEGLALDPKPFSDSLKRIGEQAKDWDETPRTPVAKPVAAAPAVAPVAAPSPAVVKTKSNQAAPWTAWAALCLLVMLTAQVIWLNWRAMELTKSLAELNANVKVLTEKVATWSDAETPAAPDAPPPPLEQ